MLATLYVAKKYIMSHLAQACVNYLETSLSARNACVLLSQGRLFEELHLMQRCWEVIDAQAEEALRSEGFADIDHKTLETILSRETLNAREASVFVAVMRWAEAECKRRDMEVTAESKRQVTITGASLGQRHVLTCYCTPDNTHFFIFVSYNIGWSFWTSFKD